MTDQSIVIEQTEIAAWKDLIDAAPDAFRTANGLRYVAIGGGLAINFQKLPIPLFNRVIGAGLSQPLTKDLIDEIKSFYTMNEKYLIHYSAPMLPVDTPALLKDNGYSVGGAWERVTRNNLPLAYLDTGIEVQPVNDVNKESWVRFLCDTYGFNFYEWPRAFCPRAGWKHYVAMKGDAIVACRSFFVTGEKTVFSGVDAPVPGVMTSETAPDRAIWHYAINELLQEGATLFVADIELPDKEKNRASYSYFRELGFDIPYTRYHYRLK